MKLFINAIFAGVLAVTLISCGGGGAAGKVVTPEVIQPLRALPSALTATVSDADRVITLSGGTGSYSAASDNIGVVAASINGSNLTLDFIAVGTAAVTVRDSAGTEISVAVTVTSSSNALQLSPSSLSILEGAGLLNLTISGGNGTYSIFSNNPAVTVGAISGTNLPITIACLPSEATSADVLITLIDGAGASTTSKVTLTNGNAACNASPATPLTLLPSALTATASDADRAVTISGGTGSYLADSDNLNVVSTSISGNNLILNFNKEGSTSVTVRDSAGTEAKIAVNVTSSTNALQLSPSNLSILEGTGGRIF